MNSEPSKHFGALVPQSWISQFETLSQQTGQPIEELVRQAFAQYLGIQQEIPSNSRELQGVQAQLEELNQKVKRLEVACDRIYRLETRLTALERLSPSVISNASVETKIEDGDYDDEPDEILRDFLPH